MKSIFTTLIIFCIASKALSQHYQVDTLYKKGPLDNRINVVILGDGFTQEQLPKFAAEAKKFADFFLAYDPYTGYRDYFNFFAIRTPSKETGVTNPGTAPDAYQDQPVGSKDTFFGASFGHSIHRLVEVTKFDVLYNLMSTHLPAYDLIVVLVNTEYYGGSGGQIAVHTLNDAANSIGVHEIGHSFGRLSDEYWAGSIYGTEAANMTGNSDPASIRWRNWLNSPNIGIYKHGLEGDAAKWHKPGNGTCLMEYLDQQLCAVCREATVERLLENINPIEKIEPDTAGKVDVSAARTFKLGLLKPNRNTLQVRWHLNDTLLPFSGDEISLDGGVIPDSSVLTATVFDSTALSRRDASRALRSRAVSWSLKSSVPAVFKIVASADSVCLGNEVALVAQGCAGPLKWSTGETGKSITVVPDKTTIYSCSCQGPQTKTVEVSIHVMPLPSATAANGGPYLVGDTIKLVATGGKSYMWRGPLFFASISSTVSIPNAALNQAGLYEVGVKDANGCAAIAQTEVKIDPILSVPNEPDAVVSVSPNPARDYISVETKLEGKSNIKLYDQAGRELISDSFEKRTRLPLNLPSGIYLYRVTNGSRERTGKVAVQ
nr:M64 family metallopeptidase [uncultured Dyadobacter sp.]